MKVSVRVPATTANLGPGFDSFGMALPIYNEITIEETVMPGTGIEITILSNSQEELNIMSIPTDKENIVYKAVELLYNSIGQNPSELKITIKSDIPIAKGLGSSSSVIVGGLLAANELLGRPADEAALLSIAAEVEGHPDNVTPAIVGGTVISSLEEDGSVVYRKLNWPQEWKVMVCVPDYELATDIARSVIPKEVPLKDAIFNAKHCAMFVQAVTTKDEELMKIALKDKLHQPYRMKLVPGLSEIIEAIKHEPDALGCVLSGAGPSVLVVTKGNSQEKIKDIVRNTWANLNVKSDIHVLKVEEKGACVLD